MESLPVPSSLIGALVFFGLLGMIAWLLVRETLRVVLRPALALAAVVMLAVWVGVLDETVVGESLAWLGDRLVVGVTAASEWATDAWEGYSSEG